MMLMCNSSRGAAAIFRLDSVARLSKGMQIMFCRVEKCLGQLLWQVVSREVVVEAGKRSVRQELTL
jgi:hypothetical protein